MRLFDHFDLLAPIMDRASAPEDNLMRTLLDLPCEGLLLDAGGGTGRVIHQLALETGGVLVVDVSQGMLKRTLRRYPEGANGVQPLRASVNQLPFPDGAMTRILVVDAWHHFADQEGAADELVRVLAPGGLLLVDDPNAETFKGRLLCFLERVALMDSRVLPASQLAAMFRSRGLAVKVRRRGMNATFSCVKAASGRAQAPAP